jgi:hypothetical protein
MKIQWRIEKKRGNFRPGLAYTMELEEYERRLAVEAVNIRSLIPWIEAPNEPYCLPECHERATGWQPEEYHWLTAPFFRDGRRTGFIRLPFRESNDYPEVAQSFTLLREAHEQVVQRAWGWQPHCETGTLDLSPEVRRTIAAKVTAERMLSF